MDLISLQLKTSKNFDKNLSKLIKHIEKAPNASLILAPELCLTGYAYDKLDKAVKLTEKAVKLLKFLSNNKTIALTMTTKNKGYFYNTLHIFHNGKIIHKQSKHKLFVLNDERKYFTAGDIDDITISEINGVKIGTLICFELRFIDLWERLQGCDIILIPAMWGALRKQNLETLSRALAVANQCFVVVSDSANEDMAKSSSIISPFGNVIKNDSKKVISGLYEPKEIKKMRRYLPIGIK